MHYLNFLSRNKAKYQPIWIVTNLGHFYINSHSWNLKLMCFVLFCFIYVYFKPLIECSLCCSHYWRQQTCELNGHKLKVKTNIGGWYICNLYVQNFVLRQFLEQHALSPPYSRVVACFLLFIIYWATQQSETLICFDSVVEECWFRIVIYFQVDGIYELQGFCLLQCSHHRGFFVFFPSIFCLRGYFSWYNIINQT